MKVHIGAGGKYWPGWTNVDLVGDQDIMADITDLPFDNNSVDEIQGIHVFEHLHRLAAPKALKEWRRVLKPEGRLVLEMPCLDSVIVLMANGERDFRKTLYALYGDPNYENEHMMHKWAWSKEELSQEMQVCGFSSQITTPFFHISARDMRCEAVKIGE